MDYSVKENNISLNRSLTLHRVKKKQTKHVPRDKYTPI